MWSWWCWWWWLVLQLSVWNLAVMRSFLVWRSVSRGAGCQIQRKWFGQDRSQLPGPCLDWSETAGTRQSRWETGTWMQLWSCRTGKSSRHKLVHCRNIVTFGHTLSLLRSWAADVLSTQGGTTLIKTMIFDDGISIQNRRYHSWQTLKKIFAEGNYSYGHL